jgi:hypothetical protein
VIFYSSSDRQPKCELLYVARNEAIGVPLLPLRQPGHGKVKHSDGYLVQVANRQGVEYVEPHRKAMIEVDFGNSVGVHIETLNGWLSEAGISPMSATDRERVISGIVAGLDAMGRVKRVERSNWNSNPIRSERLRRTRVENAENVASRRSFLGILGKNLQSQALVGDFGGSCIHRSSRQREKAIEMLQFFRAVSALTVSMDLIDCFWPEAGIRCKQS